MPLRPPSLHGEFSPHSAEVLDSDGGPVTAPF